MSRKFYLFFIVAASMLLLSSCRKDRHDRGKSQSVTLDVSIDAGEMYQLDLRQYGEVGSQASITSQTSTHTVSEITRNGSGNLVYQFLKAGSPKVGGNGTDQVQLKITGTEDRCRRVDETKITINFTIR
jgi:hypothetical protein